MTLKSLLSAGTLITLGTLIGRALGLLRETLLAAGFGIGAQASIAIALLIIPDFVTNVLISSAAPAVLIPAFASRSRERAIALFWQALAASMAVFALVALIIYSQHDYLQNLLTGGQGAIPGGTLAFALVMASLPLSAATAIVTAWLQYSGKFLVPSFANAIFNMVVIAALWFCPASLGLLAVAIVVAALIRLFAHFAAFAGSAPGKAARERELTKPLLKSYGAAAGSGALSMLPQFVPYAMIAVLGASVALFNYAFKLVLMPSMILHSIIQLALLPWLVRQRTAQSTETMQLFYSRTLQFSWIISFSMCLALSMASGPVAALCFGYGKMTQEDIARVGEIFAFGVWAMPPMVLTSVWQQIFFANEQTRFPFIVSGVQAVLTVPLFWLGYITLGLKGVLGAYGLLQVISFLLLARYGHTHGMSTRRMPSDSYWAMTVASICAFTVMAVFYHSLHLSGFIGLAYAVLTGILVLAAGLASSKPVRVWAQERFRA